MFKFEGKAAIVTGGANGIGLATVKMLLERGTRVVVADINEELLHKEVAALTNKFPNMVTSFVVDVSKEEDVKAMVQHAVDSFGRLDIMVANAGIGVSGSALEQSFETYKKVLEVNLEGVYLSDIEAIRQMVKQGEGGAVVNTSSIEGLVGDPNLSAYNSSKGGVRLLTKSLALEFAKNNIRVNSVHPGYIITGMVNKDTMGDAGLEYLKTLHPLTKGIGRLGKPEEIALAIVFAIENSFMTGSEIVVDGGYTCQ